MKEYDAYYFIGIGGIGMSNLASYFLHQGKAVGGYDRVQSNITDALQKQGAVIHFEDNRQIIQEVFLEQESTLVVYTPAIPKNHGELTFFRENGFTLMKRAELLGEVTKNSYAICVAGTHGKTTVSSMISHLLYQSNVGCSAFLGGVLKNYDTNLLLSDRSDIVVAEADEYDRSFHWLHPDIAVITSVSPDHLDVYGTSDMYCDSFEYFTSLIQENGYLIIKSGLDIKPRLKKGVKLLTYSQDKGDFYSQNIKICNGEILFDFVYPGDDIADSKRADKSLKEHHNSGKQIIPNLKLGVPAKMNIENSIAAIAAALICGATPEEITAALASFGGAKRRFDFRFRSDSFVYIDDYAHHPQELEAAISSVRLLYPDNRLTVIFQPHLYSRTKDFAKEFGESLSKSDEVILLPIYPAREEPIKGISSQIIFDNLRGVTKNICSKEELPKVIYNSAINFLNKETENIKPKIFMSCGAGDIDRLVPEIERMLRRIDKMRVM